MDDHYYLFHSNRAVEHLLADTEASIHLQALSVTVQISDMFSAKITSIDRFVATAVFTLL